MITIVYWIGGGAVSISNGMARGLAYGDPVFAIGALCIIAAIAGALTPATRRIRKEGQKTITDQK